MALEWYYLIFETIDGHTLFVHRDKIISLRTSPSGKYYVLIEGTIEYSVSEKQFKIILKELNINAARLVGKDGPNL